MQYSADLAHYFKKSSHFVKKEVTIESLEPNREFIELMFNMSLEEFFQRILKLPNAPEPFVSQATEKLFRTELDMDIEEFYHNIVLIILGDSLSFTIDANLMESTFNQIKSAVEEYEQDRDINYDGIFVSNDDIKSDKIR